MLRPIDKLSEIVGRHGLNRANRLMDEASALEELANMDGTGKYDRAEINDRRNHAALIREIHRLSNPNFKSN